MSAVDQSGQDLRLGSLSQGDNDLGQGNCEVEADSGVLDECRIFDYCLLYYLGANFPIKKETQLFIYISTIYVLNINIIK